MQFCSKCGQSKEAEEFSARRGKKQPWCKECNRAYARQYYRDNATRLKKEIYQLRLARMASNQQYVRKYLSAHPCTDCGEADPIVLEFDHVRGEKREVISTLVADGYSLKTIIEEMDKCEVVCANCHRRRTAHRGGFYKTRAS